MSEPSELQTLTWKGEVEFRGTPEEFEQFQEAMSTNTVRLMALEKLPLNISSGYIAPITLRAREILSALNATNSVRLSAATIRNIAGGIRTPHLHIGNEVVLIEREQFKTVLGELARGVFEERVAGSEDFYDMVGPLAAVQPK